MQKTIDALFLWGVKSRNAIVFFLTCVIWCTAAVLLLGSYATAVHNPYAIAFYDFARDCGEYAIVLFILVSIPGIARRFQFQHKLIMLVMMFRRQLGILTYMFVLIHSMILRIVPWLMKEYPVLPMEIFILCGICANALLFLLFITSNDWSVKKLGDWWGKIHDLMYVIVWCIFAHVALQSIGTWTVLIGATALLQLASHIYATKRLRSMN